RTPFIRRTRRTLGVAALVVAAATWRIEAGGPLIVINGLPVLWANHEVRGGPLNSATVTIDGQGRRNVIYHVDAGTLRPPSNAQAVHFTQRIFDSFSNVETSSIRFVNGGPILDPTTGAPFDVNATNVLKVLDSDHPTFQNPIIFDSNGAITGSG